MADNTNPTNPNTNNTNAPQNNAANSGGPSAIPNTPPSPSTSQTPNMPKPQSPNTNHSASHPTPPPASMMPSKPQISPSETPKNPSASPQPLPPTTSSSTSATTPNIPPKQFQSSSSATPAATQSLPQPTPANSAITSDRKSSSGMIMKIAIVVVVLLLLGGGGYFAYRYLSNSGLVGGIGNPVSNEEINLTYWGLWEPESVMQPFIDEYEAAHPNVTITYQNSSPIEYSQRLRSALEKDEGGPDIFRIHNTWTYMLNENLSSIPPNIYTNQEYQQTFYKIAYQNFLRGNDLVAIPLMYDGLALYYNVDLFNKAGVQPPTDWATFQSAARAIKAPQSGPIDIAGAAIGSTGGIENWGDIVGLLMYQNQANPINPTERVAHDALTFYGLFSYRYNVWNKTWPSATEQFALGKVGMMFGPSYRVFEIKKIAQENDVDIDFRIIPVPQLPETNVTWASFWGEAVWNKSPNKEEAWKFIKFLSEKDTMQRMFAEQSKVREFGEPPSRRDLATEYLDHPYVGPYLSQAEAAASFPLTMGTTDVDGINDRIIKAYEPAVEAISNGTAPAGPLNGAKNNVNTVLKSYGLAN